ncbi:putative Ribulose bisphosphate carboxylase small chain chloroplast precursor [Tripterygium wilfordii]|uniref:Ribulose bisphosphate carboxylase small subunit n=1 Tax=Tripterygium wilfordii TaxID=458696 RepID=A0A7J7DVI9_TRIWF|nr:putative Ribulose bisphosphate carboxylase small chain chloroplast precursor [Tripterygium wilfordii]
MVAPFTGLKSSAAFPVTRKPNNDFSSLASNGGRLQCMKVWPTVGLKKFETLSYLPPLTDEALGKEIDYLLRMGWIPCLEFELEHGFVYRENNRSPAYYDGRLCNKNPHRPIRPKVELQSRKPTYQVQGRTTTQKTGLPVLKELQEAKTAHPDAFIRIIGFDNKRQVQCISFIAYKPAGL